MTCHQRLSRNCVACRVRGLVLMAALLAVALAVSLSTARAGERPVVVELFTSQGCSSCPPADRLLYELSHREDLIVMSLHVDYWDYLGWRDVFASPAFTARQRGYAKAAGVSTIYTPQVVVQGSDRVAGTREMEIEARIAAHANLPEPVVLRLERSGARLHVSAKWYAHGTRPSEVLLVRVTPRAEVTIEAGENAGRMATYVNIVRTITRAAVWDGLAPLDLVIDLPEDGPDLVMIQAMGHGPILAARRLPR